MDEREQKGRINLGNIGWGSRKHAEFSGYEVVFLSSREGGLIAVGIENRHFA